MGPTNAREFLVSQPIENVTTLSPNFSFLKPIDELLVEIAARAVHRASGVENVVRGLPVKRVHSFFAQEIRRDHSKVPV